MTQKQLILKYINEFGSITPARMGGRLYKNTMFGSEASRTCRTLRADGKLQSVREGKFEKFFITKPSESHRRFDEDNVMRDCTCPFKVDHS